MKDVHPYPQDITADPYLVFGGLFSRKVVTKEIESHKPTKPDLFSGLIRFSDVCSQEDALQRGIEQCFNHNKMDCKKPFGSPRWDRLLGDHFGIEIKLDKHKFDPQFWQGSKKGETAIEQTRRYLDEEKSKIREWALLTNGKVIRLMHKETAFNFIDLWICDSNHAGETKQATFFEHLITKPEYLQKLLSETFEERHRFNSAFANQVSKFWDEFKTDKKDWNVAIVQTVLIMAFYRFLEDTGILPVLSPEYQPYRLDKKTSASNILRCFQSLQNQKFITREKINPIESLISHKTLQAISQILENREFFIKFKALFWDNYGAVDLSDLSISFFGNAYQIFANKTDINGVDGQYFTGTEIAKETAMYFVEDEKKGLSKDEIIFDPFVGSGQLLRALIPFFHILMQGELNESNRSVIGGMRSLALRLAGTDIDENACWLARLSLTIATAEKGKPLLDLSDQIKTVDVFESCFGYNESRWQDNLKIKGKIRGILTNPPWRLLNQTTNELYSIETNGEVPKKQNKENWKKYQSWLKNGGQERTRHIAKKLHALAIQHKETFHRTGQRKVNVALSGLDFIDRLKGVQIKKWVIFLPDSFFVGKNTLRLHPDLNIRKYYSYPFNEHFSGADGVMKFGIVFGGGSPQKNALYCHPMGGDRINVFPIFKKLGLLPIYESEQEAAAQEIWLAKAKKINSWKQGEFNETSTPQRGAIESASGIAVRGAKECNDKSNHECIFNKESITRWSGWSTVLASKARVIVRDKRSNTKTQKVLWAGVHIPGRFEIPTNCALSNAWNYMLCSSIEAQAYANLLNTPIADLAIRSIGSKRNINPKDLNIVGLPEIDKEIIKLLAKSKSFAESSAITLLLVFEMSQADAKELLNACKWISQQEKLEILKLMNLDVKKEAELLFKTKPKTKRGQIKIANKAMGRH